MIDFHSHIVPQVDDGSKNIEMSKNMIFNAIKEGTKIICASSHYIPLDFEQNSEEFFQKVNELKEEFANEPIEIVPSLEVYLTPELPRLYDEKKIWCINEKKYMLIELPMREFPMYTEDVLYELRLKGVIPIIAHPERNLKIAQEPNILKSLVEQGNIAQLNAGSLNGLYGKTIMETSEVFVKRNLIHMIGSDGHNDGKRNTFIKDAFEKISYLNKDLYNWILKNQENIINGQDVEPLSIIEIKKKGFLSKLFKR